MITTGDEQWAFPGAALRKRAGRYQAVGMFVLFVAFLWFLIPDGAVWAAFSRPIVISFAIQRALGGIASIGAWLALFGYSRVISLNGEGNGRFEVVASFKNIFGAETSSLLAEKILVRLAKMPGDHHDYYLLTLFDPPGNLKLRDVVQVGKAIADRQHADFERVANSSQRAHHTWTVVESVRKALYPCLLLSIFFIATAYFQIPLFDRFL